MPKGFVELTSEELEIFADGVSLVVEENGFDGADLFSAANGLVADSFRSDWLCTLNGLDSGCRFSWEKNGLLASGEISIH